MISFNTNSRKDIFIHFGIMFSVAAICFLIFFFLYLPGTTHHGESITVPDLTGMKMENVKEFIEKKDLRLEVSDSTFEIGKPPLTIISQYPKPGAKVKQNRKVYITITSKTPPKVKMPDLVGKSLRSAEMLLQSLDLQHDNIEYKPDLAINTILEQKLNGENIKPKTEILKGSMIHLIVSDGRGEDERPVPNLIGKSIEEVSFILKGSGLQTGATLYEEKEGKSLGKVFKQNPAPVDGNKVRTGDIIDVWIAGKKDDAKPTDEGGTKDVKVKENKQ